MKEFGKTGEILDDFWINIERLKEFWIDMQRGWQNFGRTDQILREIERILDRYGEIDQMMEGPGKGDESVREIRKC